MPATYQPLASTTLTTATATVTFSSIPSIYTDLVLVCNGYNATADNNVPRVTFNSDTATNYSITSIYGTGSAAGSTRASSQAALYLSYQGGWSTTSTNRATIVVNIMDYANTTTNKTILSRSNRADNMVEAIVGLWRKTPEAINRIDITVGAGTIADTSTFTLYGVKAG